MVKKQTKGDCKGVCGRVAGIRAVTTTKKVASPARYGGEECDLEPEKTQERCTTDCCPGNPSTHMFS